jgi:hypothetical protein
LGFERRISERRRGRWMIVARSVSILINWI